MNLYGYAEGDPVNYADPFGLCVLGIRWCPARDKHYARNTFNIGLPTTLEEMQSILSRSEKSPWGLVNPEGSIYHRSGAGNGNNQKYVNKKTGAEVIYNWVSGEMVKDPSNLGTFNFSTAKIGHFFVDVIPYWLWGNSADDKTSLAGRILGPERIENTWEDVNHWLSLALAAGVTVTVRY
jgi:hypothetical protein